jgi:hypothetical protein
MKCHEAKRHLDLFMDGELSVPENLKVLEHLNLCRACGSAYEGEKALRAGLRGTLGAERAPAGLASRVFARLEPAEPVSRFLPRWNLVAAAVFFLFAGALVLTPREFQVLAGEVVSRHDTQQYACNEGAPDRDCLCAGCCFDVPGRIRGFFDRHGRPDFCAHLEAREALGYVFRGVAAWPLGARRICWTNWRTPSGGTVSHALVDTGMAALGTPRLTVAHGRWVFLEPRPDRRSACVFVFDDEAELRRFARLAGLAVPAPD